jgi:hypothetical protein
VINSVDLKLIRCVVCVVLLHQLRYRIGIRRSAAIYVVSTSCCIAKVKHIAGRCFVFVFLSPVAGNCIQRRFYDFCVLHQVAWFRKMLWESKMYWGRWWSFLHCMKCSTHANFYNVVTTIWLFWGMVPRHTYPWKWENPSVSKCCQP